MCRSFPRGNIMHLKEAGCSFMLNTLLSFSSLLTEQLSLLVGSVDESLPGAVSQK